MAQVVPTDKRPITPLSVSDEDRQLLDALASRSPAAQTQYASNLQNVNAYIRDAEESAQADPNDEEAQQIVMDAYEQRAAVYEMALRPIDALTDSSWYKAIGVQREKLLVEAGCRSRAERGTIMARAQRTTTGFTGDSGRSDLRLG